MDFQDKNIPWCKNSNEIKCKYDTVKQVSDNLGFRRDYLATASLHKLATGRKLATTHLNVSNRQMCRCTGFKSGDYNKSYYTRQFKNDTGL